MDGFHQQQFIIIDVCGKDEIQTSISSVDDLEVLVLRKTGGKKINKINIGSKYIKQVEKGYVQEIG